VELTLGIAVSYFWECWLGLFIYFEAGDNLKNEINGGVSK
jgi:hypothetical protein